MISKINSFFDENNDTLFKYIIYNITYILLTITCDYIIIYMFHYYWSIHYTYINKDKTEIYLLAIMIIFYKILHIIKVIIKSVKNIIIYIYRSN